jgi:hypothetical protein
MVVLKAGEHSCRMTHAKIWKGKREHFGIIFQHERFGIISRLWSLLLREGLRCPSQLGGGGGQESSSSALWFHLALMVAASSPPRAQRICTLVWVSGWVGVRVCGGEGGGGGGSRYLGCVSGGVATVISLGIRSSLGFRFRIRFRVGIRCRTPDMCPGC